LGGAEEWRGRAPDDRLSAVRGLEAAAALARLYAAMRLFVNFFQPSFKLATKAGGNTRNALILIPVQKII
jgi:hypothetical protein